MKKILLATILGFLAAVTNAQTSLNCSVQGIANPTNICLGDSVMLTPSGSLASTALQNYFNNGFGAGWSASADGTVTSAQCIPSPNPPYLWMGNATPGPRVLATNPLNVSLGGTVSFWMRYSIQSQASPCEGPDLVGEGVYLQYSVDGGANWITMNYWPPLNGGFASSMTVWANYVETIPPAAQTTGTLFRWAQLATSGNGFDHWGLDDIEISTVIPFDFVWSTGNTGSTPFYVSPTTTTTYTVSLISAIDTCTASVTVNVNPIPVANLTSPPQVCQGSPITFNGSGSTVANPATINTYQLDYTNNGSFDYTGGLNSQTFVYNTPGLTDVKLKVISTGGCSDDTVITILVNPKPNALFTSPDTICGTGISFNATASNVANPGSITGYSWDFDNNGTYEIINGSATPSFAYLAAGNYTINMITQTADGCLDTSSKVVSVNFIPNADFGVTPINNCNQTVNFNASSSTGSILNYFWDWTSNASTDQTTSGPNTSNTYPGPGTYTATLIVRAQGSCYDTTQQTFTVHPVPVPSFTIPASICGLDVQPNATGSTVGNPDNITTYNWDFNNDGTNDLTNAGATPNYTFPASGNYTVNLTVVSNNGCSASTTQNIAVNTIPVAALNVSPTLNCNQPVTLNASGSTGQISSFQWDFTSDGTIDQTTVASGVTHNFGAPGTYTVSLTVNATGACTDVITQTVVVNPVPVASFVVPPTSCVTTIPFNASSSSVGSPSTITDYAWDFNGDGTFDSNLSNANTNNTYPADGTYNVTLQVTSSAGCTNSITQPVTVLTKPTALFSFTPALICDEPVNFDASASNMGGSSSGIQTYSWDYTTNGSIDNSSGNPLNTNNFGGPGTYQVSLIVQSTGGCLDTLTQTVVVNPKPVPNIAPLQPACSVDALLNGSGSTIAAPGSIQSYNWDINGDGQTDATGATVNQNFNGPGTYNVVLTVVGNSGCSAQTQTSIVLLPIPTADFATANVCLSALASFTDSTTVNGGNPTLTYDWDFGNGSGTSNAQNPTYQYPQPGAYVVTLTVTTDGGCTDTFTAPIAVGNEPTAAFTYTPQCFQVIDFKNTTNTNGTPVSDYLWDFGDASDTTASSPSHTYQDGGTFVVSLTATNTIGCSSTTTQTVEVKPTVALNKLEVPNILTPNGDGLNDILQLDSNFDECTEFEILFYNRWGNKIFTQKQGTVQFPGGKQLEAGVYFWVMKTGSELKSGNITIAK